MGQLRRLRRGAAIRLIAAALLAGLAATACSQGVDPLRAAAGHDVTTLVDEGGLRVGVGRGDSGQVCFAYVDSRQGGSSCMVSRWAVEIDEVSAGRDAALLVWFHPRAAEVRIPRTDGGTLVVQPRYVPGVDAHVAVITEGVEWLRTEGNAAAAYDAQGRLLGHEHNCAGSGGPPDCGPWTGLLDRELKRRLDGASPSPS